MAYTLITDTNVIEGGFLSVIQYLTLNTSGLFFNLIILLPIYIILLFALYSGSKDIAMSSAVSSFVVFTIMVILGINTTGLVNVVNGSIVFIVMIVSGLWYVLSD